MANASAIGKSESLAKALPALIVVAALVYAATAYFLLFSPLLAKLISGGSLDLTGARADVAALEEYGKSMDASLAGFAKLNTEHKSKVASMITADPAIHDLFVQMDAIAAKHGLALVSIDASVDEKGAGLGGRKTIRASANLSGAEYPEFKAFLTEVEAAARLTDIQSIVFSAGAANYSVVFRSYFIPVQK